MLNRNECTAIGKPRFDTIIFNLFMKAFIAGTADRIQSWH